MVGCGPVGRGCVAMTQWVLRALSCIILVAAQAVFGQVSSDPVTVSSEHPRLLLRPARLRLLKRERERKSPRWQQFEAFIAGKAPMPEPGLAQALYYQIAGDAEAGRQAIAWALGPGNDLRQQAIVFDWCQDAMSDQQKRDLGGRLERALSVAAADESGPTARARTMAAVALYDHAPKTPQAELERIVHKWWEGKIVPELKAGHGVIARDDAYALFELLHAIRDNAVLDLREAVPVFFKDFPIEHLMSYYPATYEGPDTEYYIGAEPKVGDPDLRLAALSRTADLAMVAYDTNAAYAQVLQGWLMHDRFMLHGTFGSPYEFLWANPYQPGLSYYLVPLVFYNPDMGHLFIRSGWDDNAKWFGYFDGIMQVFDEGHPSVVDPKSARAPISLVEAVVLFGATAKKFQVTLEEDSPVFVVGLEPRKSYLVEIDDEEMFEAQADVGGILQLEMPRGKDVGVRIKVK